MCLVLNPEERNFIYLQKSWLPSFLTVTVPSEGTASIVFCCPKYNAKDLLYLYEE